MGDAARRGAPRKRISISSRTSRAPSTRRSCRTRWTISASATRRWPITCGRSATKVKFAGWARTIACMDTYHIGRRSVRHGDRRDRQHPARGSRGRLDRRIEAQRAVGRAAVDRGDCARRARRVVDGLVRDVRRIQELGFGLFAAGIKPVDSKGRGLVMAYNEPALCGGVLVSPGDLVFADLRRRARDPGGGRSRTRCGSRPRRRSARITAATNCRRAPICATSTTSTACSSGSDPDVRHDCRRTHARLGAARAI